MSTIQKERVVVICPGRGTYTKETLGYLKKYNDNIKLVAEKLNIGQSTIYRILKNNE